MNLVLDIGNTRIKYALFNEGEMVLSNNVEPNSFAGILEDCKDQDAEHCILSASGKIEESWISSLKEKYKLLILDHQTPLPIRIVYETPETLGRDRVAGVVGAWTLFPNENSLVIDMGTCITTNIINKNGEFLGGTISPGLSMRAKAMNQFTESLPLVPLELPREFIGRNTVESLQNGVLRGTYYEIQSFIDNITPVFSINNVILTGGDAKYFGNLVNFEIFALPNLVLLGLHEILQHNA